MYQFEIRGHKKAPWHGFCQGGHKFHNPEPSCCGTRGICSRAEGLVLLELTIGNPPSFGLRPSRRQTLRAKERPAFSERKLILTFKCLVIVLIYKIDVIYRNYLLCCQTDSSVSYGRPRMRRNPAYSGLLLNTTPDPAKGSSLLPRRIGRTCAIPLRIRG